MEQGKKAGAVAADGGGKAGRFEDGRHDVEVGDDLGNRLAGFEQCRAAGQERDAHGLFVGGAFVDQAVFAEGEAVVAHIEDEGGIEFAALLEYGEDATDAFVDRAEGFGVALVILGAVEGRVVGVIDAVPAVALGLDPHGPVGRVGGEGRRGDELLVLEFALVAIGGDELGVNGFVRKIEEIRLLLLFNELDGVVGEFVGDVAFLRHCFAVDVEAIRAGEVGALAAEGDPPVEAGLGGIGFATHVPLAYEGGFVTGFLEVAGEEGGAFGDGGVVVDDLMFVGVFAGEDAGAGRGAEGGGDESVFEMGAVAGEGIEVGRFEEGLAF